MRYEGTLFGFNFDIEKKDDAEFIAWFIEKLKTMNPLLPKIMDALLNESADFTDLKVKVSK